MRAASISILLLFVMGMFVSSLVFADITTIECSSKRHRPQTCPVPNTINAKLIKQRSVVGCIRGKTWGVDRDGLWVRNGCRGEFQVEYGVKQSPKTRHGKFVRSDTYCASPTGGYAHCEVDVSGKVRLLHQFSQRNCTRGRSWGIDDKGIWVDRGCSALFRVVNRVGRPTRREVFRCSSEKMTMVRCEILLPSGIKFGKQLSRTKCVKGKTWGKDDRGVWVKGGCRAQFIANVRIDEPPPWLVGRFTATDQWGDEVDLHIRRNGMVRARIDGQAVNAELEGDLLLLDGLSYALKKRQQGFKAESTLAGRYAAILFKRK